ncbi:MAG: hypothetical protein ACRDGR_09385, partial [bacterium]
MPSRLRSFRALGPILALLVPVAAAALTPEEASGLLRDSSRILLRNAQFRGHDGPPPAPADLALSAAQEEAVRYWIVQVQPPVSDASVEALEARGAGVVAYVPNDAYIVRAGAPLARALAGEAFVRWVGAYRPDYKLCEFIGTRDLADPERPVVGNERLLLLSAFVGEDLDRLAAQARATGAE